MSADALRSLLAADVVTHVPGVFDPVSAALAHQAGFTAVHLSGAVCSAVELGLPDLGYVHGTHIASRAATLLPALQGVPVLADADTGYGNALQAVWTAQRYARAGIAGLHLEDQVSPKRCGHLAGKELLDSASAAQKIRAVCEARTGLVVVARTDAYTMSGLDDALARARSYVEAGADAVFLEGVDSPEDLAAAHAALPGIPLVMNRSQAAHAVEPLSDAELIERGVRLVLHPVAPLLAALHATAQAYASIRRDGHAQAVPLMPWADFTGLLGQPEALALDSRFAQVSS